MAVFCGGLRVCGRVAVGLRILFPVLKLAWILDIGIEISDCPAVGTQEVRPCCPIKDGPDALVVPHVRAGRYEERLTGLYSGQQESALTTHPLTAMDMRQMAHSEVCVDALSLSFLALVRLRSRWCVCLLHAVSTRRGEWRRYLLERVETLLPAAVAFDANFDASEDHLLTTAEVYSKLDDVAILYPERLGLYVGLAEADVVEEGA
jgi:hypothetical protein